MFQFLTIYETTLFFLELQKNLIGIYLNKSCFVFPKKCWLIQKNLVWLNKTLKFKTDKFYSIFKSIKIISELHNLIIRFLKFR